MTAIQAFIVGVNNEIVYYAIYGVDVTNMDGLIIKTQKLLETQETSRSWTTRS